MSRQPPVSRQPGLSPRDEIVETMINLSHLSKSHRIIVAGSDSVELYLALKRRGFSFGALASSRRTPSGQHSAGLIAGDHCYPAIEDAINQISKHLYAAASITISIESQEIGLGGKVRAKLQQLGFRIEAGARCHQGFVLAAHREEFGQHFGTIANVA
jgi:hypothetical protein